MNTLARHSTQELEDKIETSSCYHELIEYNIVAKKSFFFLSFSHNQNQRADSIVQLLGFLLIY